MPTLEGEGSSLGVLCTLTTSPAQGFSLHGMQSATVPNILIPSHPISSSPELLGPPTYNIVHTDSSHKPPSSTCTHLALAGTHANHSHFWVLFFLQKKNSPGHSPSVPCVPQHLIQKQNHWFGRKESQPLASGHPKPVPFLSSIPSALLTDPETQRPEGNNSKICCCCTNQGPECTSPSWPRQGSAAQSQVGRDKYHQCGHREGGAAA